MALECFKDSRTKTIRYKLPNGQGSVVVNAPICLKSQWLNYEAMGLGRVTVAEERPAT